MVELDVLPQTSSDLFLGAVFSGAVGGPGLSFTSSFWVSDCPGPTGPREDSDTRVGWVSAVQNGDFQGLCQYLGEGGIMSHIHIIFYVINVCQRISTYFSYRITCRHTDAFWLSVCHIESTDVYKTVSIAQPCHVLSRAKGVTKNWWILSGTAGLLFHPANMQ